MDKLIDGRQALGPGTAVKTAGETCLEARETGRETGVVAGAKEGKVGRVWKITVTVILTLTMIAVGLFLEITGPTLPYLKDRLGVNYEEVSRTLVARSIGYFIGSMFGGFLCDAFPRLSHVYFSVCLLLAAFGTGAAPWCGTLGLLALMFFLQGIAQGCLCTGLNAVVMKMWGNAGSPALISQHFGFGIGALIAPQLANAFIRTVPTAGLNMTTTDVTITDVTPTDVTTSDVTLTSQYMTTISPVTIEEQIEYPYMIIAIICLLFAIAFMVIVLMERCNAAVKASVSVEGNGTEKRGVKEVLKLLSPATCSGGDTLFGVFFFVFIAIAFIHIVGGERAMSKFLYSYARESEHALKPGSASLLNSAFWFSFTAGRGVNTLVAILCPPPLLFGSLVILNVVNGLVLAAFAAGNTTVLWVFTCSYALFLSPLFPTALVWANYYVEMTAMGVAVGYVGSAVGGMIYQWLTGYLFQYHGPNTLMYVVLGCTLNLAVIYVVLQVLGSRHGCRFKVKPEQPEQPAKQDI